MRFKITPIYLFGNKNTIKVKIIRPFLKNLSEKYYLSDSSFFIKL